MLKFFYRLKRRGGAVLFAVIAIMSLLIAMAVTAYFTARSAYQTVVSNYDFSQMYLSAISVSDMMIEALTQDTYASSANKYDGLKKEVQKLKATKGSTLKGTSTNIDGKVGNDILSAATEAPVASGILDAVTVEITHQDNYAEKDAITGASTGLTIYVFEIKTTAYYRDNTITVSDMVLNKAGKNKTPNNTSPFNTFFTATGQKLAGQKLDKDHTRVVVIKSHEISDNAYFENDWTVFPSHNGNDFLGGITAAGSVYLDKFTTHIPKATATSRHDWYIGGDFAVGNNANALNLNGNNLYVKGDCVLGGNGFTLDAGDVYIMGDLYLCSGGTVTINANVHVQGNIYYGADEDITSRVNNVGAMSGTYLSLNTTGEFKVGSGKKLYVNGSFTKSTNGSASEGTWDPNSVTVPVSSIKANTETDKFEETVKDTSLTSAISSKTKTTSFDTYTATADTMKNTVTVNLDEIDGALPPSDLASISTIVAAGGAIVTTETKGMNYGPWGSMYGNCEITVSQSYTAGGIHYHKVAKLVDTGEVILDEECFVDASGNVVVEYEDGTKAHRTDDGAEFVAKDGTVITATLSGGTVTIDVPYDEDGYLIDFELGSYNTNNLIYNFNVPDSGDTMPVVLKANFNDGSSTATDGNGNNAFSWRQGDTGNGCESKVQLVGDGNILFELGNYNTTTGKYVSYDPEVTEAMVGETKVKVIDYSKLQAEVETTKYCVDQKETVGTEEQVSQISGNWQTQSVMEGMLSGSQPKSGYDDRIMLVSNKNGGVAVDGNRIDNTFCGYIYAPNGIYDQGTTDPGGNCPIFGGMIVSSYITRNGFFNYCEPKPSVISEILGSMTQYTPDGGESTPADGYWITSGVGKNYLG